MFDITRGPMLYVFAVESHCAVAILTAKLSNTVADRLCDRPRDPFCSFFAVADEKLLDFAVVDILINS